MYRCSICKECSEPGQPKLLHTIYREVPAVLRRTSPDHTGKAYEEGTRKEIARELPVCVKCHKRLEAGVTLGELSLVYRPKNQFVKNMV